MPKIFALRHQLAEQQARLHGDIKDRLSPTQEEVISHADFQAIFKHTPNLRHIVETTFSKSILMIIQGRFSDGGDWQPRDPFQDDWKAQGEEQPLELVTRRSDPGRRTNHAFP